MPKSSKTLAPTIGAVLLCDDVRKESNGKDIIIGVYSGDVVVRALPATIMMMAWLEFTPTKIGTTRVDFRFLLDDVPIIAVNGNIEVTELGGAATISFPKVPLKFDKPGLLQLDLAFDGGPWIAAKSKPVRVGEVPNQQADVLLPVKVASSGAPVASRRPSGSKKLVS